jgi:adenosylcobinamide-phosphate synthase
MPVQAVFLYKTVNTLDSMVGYIQEPYREIGFFSAKCDDVLNYFPARIGSLCMLIAGASLGYSRSNGWLVLKRDRRQHKSPNCGYPEAVVAGLLRIQIGGSNTYFDEVVVKPTIGDELKPLDGEDIHKTIRIMYGSELILVILSVLVLALK